MNKITRMLLKIESFLPMELALSVSYQDCLMTFKGRFSKVVYFTLMKEREEVEVPVSQSKIISKIPLVNPIKYAEPLDELSIRRARLEVDLAVTLLMQEREIKERREKAIASYDDQEPTLKVA